MSKSALRQMRGKRIAASTWIKIKRLPNGSWLVPSEAEPTNHYVVKLEPTYECSCPDFRMHPKDMCKHMWAVHYRSKRRVHIDGPVVRIFDPKTNRWEAYWSKTPLSSLAGLSHGPTLNHAPAQLSGCCATCGSTFEADPLFEATWADLEAAFISLERRIEALMKIGNHHARKQEQWLGRWQQRIEASLAKRAGRKCIYHEDDGWSLAALSEQRDTVKPS